MSELDKLIEAVEAGYWGHSYGGIATKLGMDFAKVNDAYNGSLDAAMALHEALLPGWGAKIEMQTPVDVQISFAWVGPREEMLFREHATSMHCPARAWLLAILRAYRQHREA